MTCAVHPAGEKTPPPRALPHPALPQPPSMQVCSEVQV